MLRAAATAGILHHVVARNLQRANAVCNAAPAPPQLDPRAPAIVPVGEGHDEQPGIGERPIDATLAQPLLRAADPVHDEQGRPITLINGAQFGAGPGNPGDQTFTLVQAVRQKG